MMDFRRVMSPFTASNLKVKKANVLKDFLTIAGPMNVKHLVTFSKTRETVGMRLITVPKGPTMSFAIDEFALRKKVSPIFSDDNPLFQGCRELFGAAYKG